MKIETKQKFAWLPFKAYSRWYWLWYKTTNIVFDAGAEK